MDSCYFQGYKLSKTNKPVKKPKNVNTYKFNL